MKTGIDLVVGQNATIDLVLTVGQVRQVVTVEEAAPTVEMSTQDTSGLVNERQVKQLPLNGRSYDGLMTLNPGVVNYTSERSGGVGTSNSALGNMFAVSGRRPQENLFLLNGIEFTSASLINLSPGGASGQLLGVDAVREFNVVSSTYGAGVRQTTWRPDKYRDGIRWKRDTWLGIRILAEQRLGFQELFRSGFGSTVSAERFRRSIRRPDSEGQDVPVWKLRRV